MNEKHGQVDIMTSTSAAPEALERLSSGTCLRCGGMLVQDHCMDLSSDTREIDCRVLRCIQCGDVIDSVILRNRSHKPEPEPKKKNLKWASRRSAPLAQTLTA